MAEDQEPPSWKATLERGAKIHYVTRYDPTPRVGTIITELKCIAGLDWVYHVQVDDDTRSIVYVRPEYITARWQPPPPYSVSASGSGSRSQPRTQRSEASTYWSHGQPRPSDVEQSSSSAGQYSGQETQFAPVKPTVSQPPTSRRPESQGLERRPDIPHASRPSERGPLSPPVTQRSHYQHGGVSFDPPAVLTEQRPDNRRRTSNNPRGVQPEEAEPEPPPPPPRFQAGERVLVEIPGGAWTSAIINGVLWGLSRFGGFAYTVNYVGGNVPSPSSAVVTERAVRPDDRPDDRRDSRWDDRR